MMKFVELHRAKLPDWQIPRDGQVSILMVHDPRWRILHVAGR